ncbi:MAG: hypothetical protein RLZZ618_2784 [Pseudomonadota bacterium]|jgi:uncharacterized membrane protein YhaH (DUF805 family)
MTTSNPYLPPNAAVEDVQSQSGETQPIKMWSATGRIGRLRFLAYNIGGALIAGVVANIVTAGMGPIAGLLVQLPYLVFMVLISIQRSHDMNWTGWTCILSLIPIVNFIWIFKAGTPGDNLYGPPPPPNTAGVKVLAWMLPVIALLGILAAVSLPAYQAYTEKARAAQMR